MNLEQHTFYYIHVVFYVKPTKLKNFEDVHVSFIRIVKKSITMPGKR